MSPSLAWEAEGRVNAPVLVLLPGLGGSRNAWARVRPLLLARYRLVLLDLPGTGASRELPDPLTIEAIGDQVLEVLDRVGAPQFTVAGHALGGLVGTAVAASAPDRVSRLIAINTPVTIASRRVSQNTASRLLLSRGVGPVAWQARTDAMLRVSLEDSFAPGFTPPDEVVRDFREGSRSAFLRSSDAVDAFLRARPLPARFAALPMATALIFGMQDRRVDPNVLPRLHAASPRTQILEIAESGHSPHWETPQRVADAILEQPVRAE